jgi:outer membrane protein TolC
MIARIGKGFAPGSVPAAALLAAALTLWSGCASVPDEQDMRDWRAERSEARLGDPALLDPTTGHPRLSGDLRLAEALAKAMTRNLALQQARQERGIAQGRIQASYTEVMPSLDLTAGYLRRDEAPSAPREGGGATTRSADDYSAGLRLTQPLFNGRAGAAVRTGKLYRMWSETVIRQAEEDVRFQVISAYYKALLAAHLLEVNLSSQETAERQLVDTQARRRQGMASNYDVLRAEVEVSNFRAQALQSRNEYDVARTTLFRLIGASPDSDVKLTDTIPLVIEDIPLEQALSAALACRADLAQAEYALRLQRESVAEVRGRYWPEVSAYLSQEWANPDPHDAGRDRWGDQWQAGVQATLPLFDGLGRHGALIQEQARLEQAELALRDAEEQTVSEVRQLVLSLRTAEEFAHSQNRNLSTAREALRLVETGLQQGQNTPVEVMDARQALTTASANYYRSLFDHAMARVALQKAMGRLSGDVLPDAPVLGAPPEARR